MRWQRLPTKSHKLRIERNFMKPPGLIGSIALLISCVVYGTEVRLIDQVAIQAPSITLGEIAIIDSNDRELRGQLAQLVVGQAPALGKKRIITAMKIRSVIAGTELSMPTIKGIRSSVQTESRALSSEELKTKMTKWITDKVDPNKEVEVHFLHGTKKWAIPAGRGITISVESGRQKLAGSATLTLKALAGEQLLATRRVRINIKIFQETPVLLRPLKRGSTVTSDDLELRRTEVTTLRGMEIAHISDVVGLVTKRQLPMGHIATINDFDQKILIERGSLNRIMVVNGPVRMNLVGAKALQGGKKGEYALFSNPANQHETLRAKVIRPGLALLKIR
jgi:flagella basal body P-ring formation protein FlgA